MKHYILTLCLTFVLASCASSVTQRPEISDAAVREEMRLSQEMAMQQFVKDSRRLYRAAYPVFKNSAELCRKGEMQGVKPSLGFEVWNEYAVVPAYRPAALKAGIRTVLTVQAVAKNSPAARAGVQDGDGIVTVNGNEFTTRQTAPQEFDDAVELAKGNTVELVIRRDGKKITKTVQKEMICRAPISLDYDSTDINAYTDGKKIVFSKGMMRFAENDTELALVVSHELAHMTMTHVDKQRQNAIVGTIGGLMLDVAAAAAGVDTGGNISQMGGNIAALTYSVEFEQEADYVGMYYLARASYSTGRVADFWRRMSIEHPAQMQIRRTHPTTPERFIAIQRVHDEIVNKKAKKEPLVPNYKK